MRRSKNQTSKDNQDIRIEAVGWAGMILILASYILLNIGLLGVDSIVYMLMNLVGSLGLLVISYAEKAYQPAVLNFVWMLVAMASLINMVYNSLS